MSTNGRGRPDLEQEGEDLPVRDRPYESFGQQGFAMATYAAPEGDVARERGEVDFPVGEPIVNSDRAPAVASSSVDEHLREEVCAHLADDRRVDASDVEVVVHHGEVSLSGTVPDPAQRALAADVVAHVRGVIDVDNHLHVRGR